ncbi:MAG: hypothetical protein IKE01_01295 [Clostridia bacterium]|nr:hypothetical protein [Clostridia bacterium]
MEVNEEKRQKFIEYAGKRVNNVLHDIQILEPMSRSNTYDFTKQDLEEMFAAMQDCLDTTKEEFYKKFEEKEAKAARKTFTFGASKVVCDNPVQNTVVSDVETTIANENVENTTTELVTE